MKRDKKRWDISRERLSDMVWQTRNEMQVKWMKQVRILVFITENSTYFTIFSIATSNTNRNTHERYAE